MALLRRYRATLGVALGLVVVNRLAALALPVSTKLVIDDVIGQHRPGWLLPIAVGAGGAVLLGAISGFGVTRLTGLAAQRAITDIRRDVQQRVLYLPIRFFDATSTGSTIARIMSDAEQVRFLVGSGVVELVSGALTAMIGLGILFWLNWKLTAVVAAVLLVFTLALGRAFTWFRAAFHAVGEATAAVTTRLTEALNGIRVIKSHAAERTEAHAFARATHRLSRATGRTVTGTAALGGLFTLGTGGISVLLLVVGGTAVLDRSMTLGDCGMYVALLGLILTPMLQLAAVGSEATRALAALDRIAELRTLRTEADEDRRQAAVPPIAGAVAFEHVSYAYHPGHTVLHDVSFTAATGTTTALVGPSGSGKSTLVRLLLAFDHPASGRVSVDGHDLTTLRRRDYRRQLGAVLQEPFLFDGTIAENIRYQTRRATYDAVQRVGRLAHCEEFVRCLPDGYDTVVGERGVKLSGGQRQRVAIARALLADPRILVLDEATSSLDSTSEALIQAALRTLSRGRTTFVIAHRLSTVRQADQILVMERGAIVERGTHEELVVREGAYASAYWAQTSRVPVIGEYGASARPQRRGPALDHDRPDCHALRVRLPDVPRATRGGDARGSRCMCCALARHAFLVASSC